MLEDFINAFKSFLLELEENGWEINDDGDIVEKKSQRLVWDIIHENKREK